MDILAPILACLGLQSCQRQGTYLTDDDNDTLDEKIHSIHNPTTTAPYYDNPELDRLATEFVSLLSTTSDLEQKQALKSLFFIPPPHHTTDLKTLTSWYESLAAAILARLETVLRTGTEVSEAVKEAVEKSNVAAAVVGFVKDHPVFCTILAIGVLVLVAPWVLEVLGFAEQGIVADSWAALWQSRYAGYVPKGSLFSFLQRLGMVCGR